jgi:acyl-CoA thioester hydrolase
VKYHQTPITVRFNEVDAYQVAWHGHYVNWMEIGRNDLAGRFDLNATQIAALGYLAPVVALDLQFKKPLRFGEEMHVQTTVQRAETATLEFHCRIVGADGTVAATGRTVHVLTDRNGELQYTLPPVIGERLGRLMAYLEV